MSPAAATAGILPPKGATVSILGRKVSWDALLVAGAGLLGVVFLYKIGQPTQQGSPMSTVDPSGGGADAASLSTVPAPPPSSIVNPYGGPVSYTDGSSGGLLVPPIAPQNVTSQPPNPYSGTAAAAPQGGANISTRNTSGATSAPVGSVAGTASAIVSAPATGSIAGIAAAIVPAAAPSTVVGAGGGGYLEGHGATA